MRNLELKNTRETFMQKMSVLLAQLYDLEKNGARRTLASYCQALALPPRTVVTLNILAGSSPYSIKVKGQIRPAKDWQEVQQDYESRLLSAVQRVFEFEDFVFQCLKALPYLDKPIVEYLMQPKYSFGQRYDVLCAVLREELKIWQFARLPDISLDVALKVYHKIFSEEEQRTIVLETRNSKYFIVAEGEELGYYLSIEFGHIKLFSQPMPVKAKL